MLESERGREDQSAEQVENQRTERKQGMSGIQELRRDGLRKETKSQEKKDRQRANSAKTERERENRKRANSARQRERESILSVSPPRCMRTSSCASESTSLMWPWLVICGVT